MDDKFYKRNLNDETGTILWKLYEDSIIKWANEFEKSGCIALQTETGEEMVNFADTSQKKLGRYSSYNYQQTKAHMLNMNLIILFITMMSSAGLF